jgi:hypothetical protein
MPTECPLRVIRDRVEPTSGRPCPLSRRKRKYIQSISGSATEANDYDLGTGSRTSIVTFATPVRQADLDPQRRVGRVDLGEVGELRLAAPYRRLGFDLCRAGVARFSDSDQIPKPMISMGCCRLD